MNDNTPTPNDHTVEYSPEERDILDRLATLAVRRDLTRLVHHAIQGSDGEDRYEIVSVARRIDATEQERIIVSVYDHLAEGNMDATIRLAAETGSVIAALSDLCPDENPATFDLDLVLPEDADDAEDVFEAQTA